METRNFIKVLLLMLAIPLGSFLFAANPFSEGDGATALTSLYLSGDLDVEDDATIGDDLSIVGDLGVVSITATGTVSAEQLTTTDDATVTDDLGVTGTTTSGELKVDATNGVTITGIYRGTATINSGASTGTATITGVTASDKAMAVGITNGSNQSVEAATPGSGSVAIVMTGNVATTTTVEVWVLGQ